MFILAVFTTFSVYIPSFADDSIWVGKSDETRSCATQGGVELDAMGTELEKAKIHVLEKRKIRDKNMRIQMCGADRGNMNSFLISKSNLEKAKTLGFRAIKN